jgi:hypothetical protein
MKLAFEVMADRRRLLFKGKHWKEIAACVHGQKLRWRCAE